MKINIKYCFVALIALGVSAVAAAQEYDDIYYNPSKSKKTKTTTPVKVADYAPAGSYSGNWNVVNNRDVDEYNRRYQLVDTLGNDTATIDDNFAYTRRIERFHNPDVVVETGNDDLIDWYYTQPNDQTSSVVNIYVNNDPWLWSYPYSYSYWYRPYYRPYGWYAGYWGPSWSWSWGYDPWYSWGYGPGWGWGWTPGPSWGWHPGPGHPVAGNWRPTSPGASRPHGAVHAGNGRYTTAGSSRPGNMGRPTASSSAGRVSSSAWMRPGNSGRPGNSSNSAAINSSSRPGASGRPSTNSSSNSSRNSYNSSSSRNSYNSSSSSSSRPSYNSGSSHRGGAGSSYGGGRGSSGGSGRGGRR